MVQDMILARQLSVQKNYPKTIMKQLEFYLSDGYIPKDKLLLKNLRKDQEGYLSLQFMASFPKMKKLRADANAIVEAMKDSTQLVLNAEKTHLKRKVPFVIPPKSPNKSTSKPPAKQTTSILTSSAETPQVVTVIENKTIYASYIPKNSDKTSLQNIFGICGTIKRIDIPTKKEWRNQRNCLY